MNFRKNMSDEVEVNLTPLIDVVFLLLIFFMVTTTFDKDAKININLPTTTNAVPSPKKQPMEVIIDGNGKFFVDGREVLNNKPETLFRAMTQALNERGEQTPPLVISADASTNYQAVVTAMDIAGRLGMTNFSMATSKSTRKK
ncbi:biopolymer transporter ExbD [Cocleimonas flava]|jgi:biopolymer transport protein ExbD|uniref:Biopolymer transport protein ExbD n=1 Tax=Cocleimonas flava TaxID=634765 RepID=A0A4R1F616_9GAMM|nr:MULTISPECIES: biopolymer transporter ExbD [Cocleimonas]MEB8431848.1 biopolymer transporter ExbD [Cocleimonas sp. KMM 6892]MEC4715066.1 biopolymer transporter ExbD [Cocleimonas sp. KMM 6895]MEC4744120.1 biopolymer transporter ExbD [Cocleimonas sp. KMM 6896]TCJ87288.1 biopolymer transport protein ExbD [Cocleimonas flava]